MTDDAAQAEPLALTVKAGNAGHGTMVPLPVVAERLACSLATVRRMVRAGQLEGAEQQTGDHGQQWFVPMATVESLLAARRARQAPAAIRATAPAAAMAEQVAELRERVTRLEAQNETLRTLADERAHQLEQLHLTMRTALTAGPEQPKRRRWRKG